MRRWVISGATGHIGNNLVRFLNRERPDDEVAVLVRRPDPVELAGTACRQIVGDLQDEQFLRSAIRAGDVVVHLACLIDLTDRRREETFAVNVGLTERFVRICREIPVARFLYVGSVDGIARQGEGTIREPEDFFPDRVEGNYGQSKAAAMHLVLQAMRQDPAFPAAMVLPSAVIGVNDRKPSAVGQVIRNCIRGKAEIGIPGGYDFVNVKDVCRALLALGENNLRDHYILSGEAVSVKELYLAVNRELGIQKHPFILPVAAVRPFLPFVRTLNRVTLKALTEPHRYSSEKAEAAFGYTRTPWRETLRETVLWFRQNPER